MAVSEQNGARVILCLTPVVPAAILRNAARMAGCHIWLDSDDIVYAGEPFIGLHTAAAGVKKVRLPAERAVVDVFAGRMISPGCKEFSVRLPRHATALYYAGDRNEARAFLRALDAQEHP
jgi:hypothetical protein